MGLGLTLLDDLRVIKTGPSTKNVGATYNCCVVGLRKSCSMTHSVIGILLCGSFQLAFRRLRVGPQDGHRQWQSEILVAIQNPKHF